MKITILDIYKISMFFFVVSLFIFENEKYATIFSIAQLLFVGLTFVNIYLNRLNKKDLFLIWLYIIFTWTLIISLLNLIEFSIVTMETKVFIKNLLLILCIYLFLNITNNLKLLLAAIFLGSMLSSLIIVMDFNSLDQLSYDLKYSYSYRIGTDLNSNPNIAALNLIFGFAISLYYVISARLMKNKIIFVLSSIFLIYGIILTGSRKAIIFCIIALLIQLVLKNKFYIFIVSIVFSLFYAVIMNNKLLYFYIGYKFDSNLQDTSASVALNGSDQIRSILFEKTIQLIFDNPMGVGFGGVAHYLSVYSHNNYVEILASIGFIGFLIFYSIYFISLRNILKKSNEDLVRNLFLSCLVGLAIIEVYQVTYLYKIPMFLIATIYYFGKKEKERNLIEGGR